MKRVMMSESLMKTPSMLAKEKFDTYAAMGKGEFPHGSVDMSRIQVELFRWQQDNFSGNTSERMVLGMTEELGELAHAFLKHAQKIRGMEDREKFLNAAGDAFADLMVYGIQLMTYLRMDAGTLLKYTARNVMNRDWKSNPKDAHEVEQKEE